MTKLAEICKVDWGDTRLTKAAYKENGKYLGVSAAGCDGRMDYYDYDAFIPVISAIGANCGKMFLPEEPFVAIKNTITLKPNDSTSGKYLYYALKNNKIPKRGGGQPFISKGDTEQYDIPYPSKKERDHIVDVLDSICRVLDERRAQLTALDELIKAHFIEMFGDPNTNSLNWEMGIINDIGKCVAGATPSTSRPEYWENGTIPWLSSGEVNKHRIYETDTKITQLGYKNASTKLVPAKTVLLAMAGQGKTRGMAAITEIELCTNQSICSIVNNERANPEYLLYFLKMQYKELRNASTSAEGRGGLNLKIIGSYPIMIPPIRLQNKFAKFVQQTDKSKAVIQKSLEKTQLLLDSLMQEYFG